MRFGISTHLFHDTRLAREHLEAVAAHGFDAIELFATRSHFDYREPSSIDDFASWLTGARLRLHSVHAPITESYVNGEWGPGFSTAAADREWRNRTVREAEAALAIARRIPFDFLVVHLGTPDAFASAGRDNSLEAARRSVEELHALATPLGVRLALEVIPNRISTVAGLIRLIDDDLDLRDVGLCLDFGHAHLVDDVVTAVEEASGHLFTTHVHDNGGHTDDHLVPFEGTIDWSHVLFAMRKVGYDGLLVLEVANTGSASQVLEKTREACRRMTDILAS